MHGRFRGISFVPHALNNIPTGREKMEYEGKACKCGAPAWFNGTVCCKCELEILGHISKGEALMSVVGKNNEREFIWVQRQRDPLVCIIDSYSLAKAGPAWFAYHGSERIGPICAQCHAIHSDKLDKLGLTGWVSSVDGIPNGR